MSHRPRRTPRGVAVLIGLCLAGPATLAPSASGAAVFTVSEYPLLSPNAFASHLTAGPDGNAWVALRSANKIARVTPSGEVKEFMVPTAGSVPNYLAPGHDGNVWFTESEGNKIAKITPAGVITEFGLPGPDRNPVDITAGPGGNMWFTASEANLIGEITPTGEVEEFPLPTPSSNPSGIAAGPDGNLWIVLRNVNKIARMTPSGDFDEFDIPTANSDPDGITAGPDGAMWFGEVVGNKIGRIDMDGEIAEFEIPSASSGTSHLAPGPDGNMWFAMSNSDKLGRITPTGDITEFDLPNNTAPHYPATDLHGNLWVTERDANKVARVQIPIPLTVEKSGSGSGVVSSEPTGLDCGVACSDTFLSGSTVTLTAVADAGSVVGGWGDACVGSGSECTIEMDAPTTVTTTFSPPSFKLSVTRRGKGTITSSPAGIRCGSDCKGSFEDGTVVTLAKKPKRGWRFVKWSGACRGRKACVVTVDARKSVTAKFVKK